MQQERSPFHAEEAIKPLYHQQLIHEEALPLYQMTANKCSELGIGDFEIKVSEDQIDDNKKPIEIPGILRIDQRGVGDWISFENIVGYVEVILNKLSIEDPASDFPVRLETAVEYAIRAEGEASRMNFSKSS